MKLKTNHGLCKECIKPFIINSLLENTKNVIICLEPGCNLGSTLHPYSSWPVPVISLPRNTPSLIPGLIAAKRLQKDSPNYRPIIIDDGTQLTNSYMSNINKLFEENLKFTYIRLENLSCDKKNTNFNDLYYSLKRSQQRLMIPAKINKIPYISQASIYYKEDFQNKLFNSLHSEGSSLINIYSPCFHSLYKKDINQAQNKAIQTCIWPLYEINHKSLKINHFPKKVPVKEFLDSYFSSEELTNSQLQHLQVMVDQQWNNLKLSHYSE